MCFRSMQNKMQKSLHPEKKVKAYHVHQKSVQEKKRSENESLEEITVNTETTYSLRNSRFRREFNQNKVISETL